MNNGESKKKDEGIHISDPGCPRNEDLPGPKVKFKPFRQSNVKNIQSLGGAPSLSEKQQSWEVIDGDDIYNDAISEVNSPYESVDIYDDARSPDFITRCDSHIVESGSYDKETFHLPETAEIQFSNMTIHNPSLDKISTTQPISINEMAAEEPTKSSSSDGFDEKIYDDVPLRTESGDRLTASYSGGLDSPIQKRKIGNPSNNSFDFISSTQSLPPNVHLSTRKLGISQEGDSKEDTMERIKMAKRKSLTLRRTSFSGSPPEISQSWEEDDNIYESVYLQRYDDQGNPINKDGYDSDDISWSSDEFESYEDSIHNEAAVSKQESPQRVGPVADQSNRKSIYGDGNGEPQHPSLLRRIKQSFRASPEDGRGEEDSPLLPVEICDIKHPPPELPPLPSGLNQNQVKRRHALGVLIESEKSYIASLQRLIDDFRKPLLEVPMLHRGKVRVELMKAMEILQYHQMFQIELAEQVKLWHTQEKIGDVFTASFSKSIVLDAYSEYVNNFTAAMEDIKKVTRQRANLRDYLKSKEMSSKDRLGLFGLMVKPVQRFPQFITCLQDLLKYTPTDHHDRLGLQRALTELENIAHKLNERKRESEQKLEAKVILSNFKENMITRTGLEQNRKLIRIDDLDQVIEASNRFKKRRLILLNDILILATVLPGRDAFEPERYKLKWCYPLRDVELKESSLSSSMQSSVRGDTGMMTVVFAKPENPDEDPFNLVTDLSELHHDYSVLSQVISLVSTLKRSYTGLSEESVHAVIRDLRRVIHGKDEQLRLVKSCSITLSVPVRTVTGGIGRAKFVFHTQSPTARQDWCLDLQIAKMALDAQNNPSWDLPHQADSLANQMPALFIKHLPVDVVRHYTKVCCAVPVFLSTPSNIGVGMQHLWVCNTTDTRGQVSIVSIHSDRPRVIESYQACDCQILCVENVPGYSAVESPYAFNTDTVWMVTIQAQVLIYPLTSSDGLTKRQPAATFTLPSNCSTLRYVDDRVFAALDNGQLAVYTRNEDGVWNISSPHFFPLGAQPVRCLLCLESHVLCTTGNWVHFINLDTLQTERSQKLHPDDTAVIGHVARAGVGLWVSYHDQPLIHLYLLETLNQLQDVNVSSAVQKALSGKMAVDDLTSLTKDIQVSCLLASKGLLWIGTDKGVVLTLPLPRLREGVPQIGSRPCVSFHGHTGPIRFLLPIFFISPGGDTLKRKRTQRLYDDVPLKISISHAAKQTDWPKQNEPEAANEASTSKDNLPEQDVKGVNRPNSEVYLQESVSEIVEKINKVFSPVQDKSPGNNRNAEVSLQADSDVTGENPNESSTCDMLNSQTSEMVGPSSQTDKTVCESESNSAEVSIPTQDQNHSPPISKSFDLKSKKSLWKSTPNLAADMEGTEDISVLYGSLMRGLDASPESTGFRRKMKRSWRAGSGSHTLQPSSSVKQGYLSDKHVRHREKGLKKKSGVAQELSKDIYEFADPLPENEVWKNDSVETNSRNENNSDELNLSTSAPEVNQDRNSTENANNGSQINQTATSNSANFQKPVSKESLVAESVVQVNDNPTSKGRRGDVSREGTLNRQPLQTCKSVIVVSGGDGYCTWNSANTQKTHKSEEATLILWLHKVIT